MNRGCPLRAFPLLLGAAVLAGCAARRTGDRVLLSNISGSQNGLLVDAGDFGHDVDDRPFVSSSASIRVGALTASTVSNEVVAFTRNRPVAVQTPVNWTNGNDDIPVPYSDRILIPVKVWIVFGPFPQQRARALQAAIRAVGVWNQERMGLGFSTFEVADATGSPQAPNYHAFDCSKQSGLQNDIKPVAGRVNVYYVDTVNNSTGMGDTCVFGGDFVALGSTTDDLLAHELGHTFNLLHVHRYPLFFDHTNVMYPGGTGPRDYLAEGQVFRAHVEVDSTLNNLYHARPGQEQRTCPGTLPASVDPRCPQLYKRIWRDGAFGPN